MTQGTWQGGGMRGTWQATGSSGLDVLQSLSPVLVTAGLAMMVTAWLAANWVLVVAVAAAAAVVTAGATWAVSVVSRKLASLALASRSTAVVVARQDLAIARRTGARSRAALPAPPLAIEGRVIPAGGVSATDPAPLAARTAAVREQRAQAW